MENDSIVITAKLDVIPSEALIIKDLETIEADLKSTPLKISCAINEDSIKQMQSQLNSLTNNLTINLGNANIQNAKVEIIPDIKKGVLEQQAKQLQQELGLIFPYGETEKLREELKGYLNEYQKAYQVENGYGEQAQAHMEKIVDFANKYRQEMVLINETLKAEQDRIREIRSEQEKVFITEKQMAALKTEASRNGTTVQAMLNSVLPNGWYSDINKAPSGQVLNTWSKFAAEINSINPFHEIANEGDIIQGIKDLAEFMSKSFTSVDNTIEKNRAVWEQWADTIRGTVGSITGQNPFADFFSEFVDISGETQTIANNMETVQDRIVQTVSVIQQSLGGNDGLSNVRFPINTQAIETFINELDQLNVQGVNIDQLRERLQSLGVTITSISPKFSQVGRAGEQVLNTLTIKGIDSANNIVTYIENFNKKTGAFEESSTKVEQSFAKIRQEEERVKSETEAVQKAMNDFLKLQGTFNVYSIKYGDNQSLVSNFEKINRLIQGFDNTAPIEKQRESIIRIDNELKVIKATIDEINRSATQTASNVERIYPNLTFTSGDSTTAILSSAKEQLNNFFNAEGIENTASRVKRAVEDASGSLQKFFVQVEREDGAVETLTYALNQQANAYEYLGKITREADNSTDFRRRGLNTQIELQTQKIEQFAATVGRSRIATEALSEDIAKLRTDLSKVGDTNAMNAFLDNFDIAKAKFQALSAQIKAEDATAKFNNNLRNLTNQIDIFANTNRKATESLRTMRNGTITFADEWQRIKTALSSDKLDDTALKQLIQDFRNFKGEADAAGLTVSRFFQSMQSQLRMVLQRWISLYAVIGYIRKMIDNVKELDNAMINLRRVTKETNEGYERFLKNANELAKVMKTTTSSLVEQAYQWSKLGYSINEALDLAQASTVFMKVADVGQDQALSNLVTTLKAFRIEAGQTMDVVDKLDKLNNRYAVSASGLGDGLERTASAMAMTGNSLEETLALLTGAGEITQNLDNTGNAIRVISLRLQNMKGKLEELDEPVDDLMEVSKTQTQILNLTKGQVDIINQETGEFKSTYEILKQISEVWDTLSSQGKSSLLEVIAGKNRANVGAALIQAFQSGQIERAYADAIDAAGTATEEYNKMMQGIQAQFEDFKRAFQEFSQAFINSDFLKGLVKIGTQIIEVLTVLIDKFGTLAVVITPILTFIGAKYKFNFLTAIVKGFKTLIGVLTGAAGAATGFAAAWKILTSALSGAVIGVAIGAIVYAVDKLVVSQKELEQQAEEMRQKSLEAVANVQEEEKAIEDVSLQYAQLAISTENLSDKKEELLQLEDKLPDAYEKEAAGIDLVNGSISENLKLLDEQKRKKAEQYVQDNQGGYEQALAANGMGFLQVGNTLKGKYRDILNDLARQNNIRGYDFVTGTIGGTMEGRIAAYKELRNLYAQEKDHNSDILAQIDSEITGYEAILKENKSIIDEMEKQKAIISITAQEYNMIEQATVAYAAYQKAVTAEDTQGAYDALNILKGIKSIVYSTSEAGSAFREEFDATWESFNLGAAESLTKLDEIQERFNNLLDNSFKDEMGNLGKIEDAINSIMDGETLSHDDAWELLGLDTDGILRDIKLIDGQFKFSTEELLQLAQQRIDKQKEEINGLKEAAEIQMANYKIQLESMKVSDYDDIKSYAIAIDSIHEDMEATQKVITQCNYLLGEADGKLAKLQATSSDIVKELNNSISAFENEVKAIENTIDSLNDRKDILEAEKDALQEELDILNEQKETLEETLKNYDAVADAVNDYVKSQTDGIQEQIDALEEERKAIEDYYNDQIDALKEQNEERDDAIKKEKALADLANAENQKRRVYSSARGWTYETSKEDIVQAQNALAEIETNEKIKALEKERDAKLGGFDERKEEYETQIEAFEEYAKKYADVASDIQKAENELLADQILGSEWRTKIEQQDETLLNNYRSEYQRFNNDLKTLVKDEIANLQASIDKKDEEIKKIDKQIEAYNRYKNTVETKLSEAKTTLENYKKDVVTYCDDMATGFENMENRIWEKHNRIIQWFREVYEAAEGLENKMAGSGIAHGAMYLAGLGSFANGGTIDYTGLAMVHGSKSNSETAFNATDSKKLYDMVHNTPNLIASIVKQSGQLGGFNPSNITNRNSTNNSSINVNIGQVVANNPAELTRNLDTHLDGYFRRKLTQGYAQ